MSSHIAKQSAVNLKSAFAMSFFFFFGRTGKSRKNYFWNKV